MTVRAKIALTIFITGLLTALGVLATVLSAFQRFEHESSYYRANTFLQRVLAAYPDIYELPLRRGDEFIDFLRSLVLFEPDTQLYLLDAQGTVLASSGRTRLPAGFKVKLEPVRQAAGDEPMPYVMGDDPERMEDDAVIAAKAVRRASAGAGEGLAGYLYLVCHKPALPHGRWAALRSSFAAPTLVALALWMGAMTALAVWIVASVTRPLRRLTEAVGTIAREGLGAQGLVHVPELPALARHDEFGRLGAGFRAMLATLQTQWQALHRLDHFRREGVSNLSHDLRSPLTATAACLETLDARLGTLSGREDERALVAVALRNTRNAARLVQSLGDLAQLDEPQFKLRRERVDLNELVDDIVLRFAPRAAERGLHITAELHGEPVVAEVDVQLLERALANLLDNAFKYAGAGARVRVSAEAGEREASLCVTDNGGGIAADELPHLFDRFYQPRRSSAPATGEGGRGLGLAIVKRIAELHGARVEVASAAGAGTRVTLWLPLVPAGS